MENKVKSFSLALLALSMSALFADDFDITRFGAKEGGVVLKYLPRHKAGRECR